jgi:thiosulfate/3-mercaptopyruvate sulfurtransferase
MSALIDPRLLRTRMDNPDLVLVDASYPAIPEFHAKARIGNAVMFDIDAICDQANPLPHMLPAPDIFAQAVGDLGIGNDDEIVVYDQGGMAMAAARVWWMFRCFGHKNVKVLNGGMPLWHALGFPVNRAALAPAKAKSYTASFNPALVVHRQHVVDSIDRPGIAIIDARGAERFTGATPDKRPGLKTGHIPGSYNIPFTGLIDPGSGILVEGDKRIAALVESQPQQIITSCGSGVTACVLALALYESGYENAAVYDGSWSEWAQPALGMPVSTGPGKQFNERS